MSPRARNEVPDAGAAPPAATPAEPPPAAATTAPPAPAAAAAVPPPPPPPPAAPGAGATPAAPTTNKGNPAKIFVAVVAILGALGGAASLVSWINKDDDKGSAAQAQVESLTPTPNPDLGPAIDEPGPNAQPPGPQPEPGPGPDTPTPPTTQTAPTPADPTNNGGGGEGAVEAGAGVSITPAAGFDVLVEEDGFVRVGNGEVIFTIELLQLDTAQGQNAGSLLMRWIDEVLTQSLSDYEFGLPQAISSPSASIVSASSFDYTGILAGQQGNTPVEGSVFGLVRGQDGMGVVASVMAVQGRFDANIDALNAMLNSVVASI